MASKTQRKAKQDRKRRQERNKAKAKSRRESRRSRVGVAAQRRLADRLSRLRVESWAGEHPVDVAVLQPVASDDLPADQRSQVIAIRETLEKIGRGDADVSLQALNSISRRSPLADWRLFAKGYVDWMNGLPEAAAEGWRRLDPSRRPARMAQVLIAAHWDDLETTNASDSDDLVKFRSESSPDEGLPSGLLHRARMIRKFQVQRTAILEARRIADQPVSGRDRLIDSAVINAIQAFAATFATLEPELTHAMGVTAAMRAYCHEDVAHLIEAASKFAGPDHDPKFYLLLYRYSQEAVPPYGDEQVMRAFLEQLRKNEKVRPEVRRALEAALWLNNAQAAAMIADSKRDRRRYGQSKKRGNPEENQAAEYFERAITAYPEHRQAWLEYQSLCQKRAEDENLLVDLRQRWGQTLVKVQNRYLTRFSDDTEVRMALVEHLIENDASDEAGEHVDQLADAPTSDPLTSAIRWKWHLCEAMRLCRRKSWLTAAKEQLQLSEAQWPSWYGKEWLPYLYAAADARGGKSDAFEAIASEGLVHHIMSLAAAQCMHVPAKDLKPLRAPIDDSVKRVTELSINSLVPAARFWWDLQRIRIRYPAYRMHGSRLLDRLDDLIAGDRSGSAERLKDDDFRAAVMMLARANLVGESITYRKPAWLRGEHADDAFVDLIEALSHEANLERSAGIPLGSEDLLQRLRQHASKQDVYYRHLYRQLADRIERQRANAEAAQSSPFGFLSDLMDRFADLAGDDEDEAFWDEHDACQCEDCRRARGELF